MDPVFVVFSATINPNWNVTIVHFPPIWNIAFSTIIVISIVPSFLFPWGSSTGWACSYLKDWIGLTTFHQSYLWKISCCNEICLGRKVTLWLLLSYFWLSVETYIFCSTSYLLIQLESKILTNSWLARFCLFLETVPIIILGFL